MTSYTVVYERDENMWLASVPAVPGCHTQGRTLAQAETRIREALRLWVNDADTARLISDVRLPRDANQALAAYWSARFVYEQARHRVRQATWDAVRVLTAETHLGVRDAGDLVGLSLQRVQQVAAAPPPMVLDEKGSLDSLASIMSKSHFVSSALWTQSAAMTFNDQGRFTQGVPPVSASFALAAEGQSAAVPFTLRRGEVAGNQSNTLAETSFSLRRKTDWIDPIGVQPEDTRFVQQQRKVAI